MDFEQIVLSKQELDDLRRIAQKPVKSTEEWMKRTAGLYKLGLIRSDPDPEILPRIGYVYSLSNTGKSYLQYLDRREREKQAESDRSARSLKEARFANKISIFALIVSVIALIVSVFR